jgi:GDP/UDP-N,N'-diacetylbacillosamine 2-epimerase (hydrolysing)
MAIRRILYVTGTRADFGLMQSVLNAIEAEAAMALSVAVTGMHLSPRYGSTVDEVRSAGFRIASEVPVPLEPANGATTARNIGTMLQGFTAIMEKEQPDIVLLLGDRGEMLAGALAAIHLNIPVAHVHGGERSGTVDEAVRHAISKLSHIHLVASSASRQRLIAMGEQPDLIFVVGAPGLDGLDEGGRMPKAGLMQQYGLDPNGALALLVYHPVLQEAAHSQDQMRATLKALADHDCQLLALQPNSDAGGDGVRAALAEVEGKAGVSVQTHLPREAFLDAMAVADLMIGNSSAAIIEAASFGIPVVNIGIRQNLRERNANVRDVPNDAAVISDAISQALSEPRYPIANIYGDGHSAEKIVGILRSVVLDITLMNKVNSY